MLTCIACSKQLGGSIHEQEDEDSFQTPRTKQTVKTFTDQIKDMAVKASGAYKHCKPCSGSMSQRSAYAEESGSERFLCSYRRTESSSSGSLGKETETKSKSLSRDDDPLSMGGKVEPPFFMEEEEPKEWIAQVEPGILITFISLPEGGNSLKRIRFSRELFEKLQAQRWWAENYDRIMELYNVQKFNRHSCPLTNLPKSEHENASTQDCSNTPALAIDNHAPNHNSNPRLSSISGAKTERSSLDASIRGSSSGEADQSQEHSASVSNASDLETEWVEQDEPGVYITIRALSDGTRELRRVRFSREKFGEIHARIWWEENRTRIQEQYL